MSRFGSRLPLSGYPVLRTTEPRIALQTAIMFSDTRSFDQLYPSGPFALAINSTAIANVRLGAVASTGHKVEVFDRDFITGIVPMNGVIRVETGSGTVEAAPGHMLLTGAHHRLTTVSRDYSAMTLQIPRHGLNNLVPVDNPLLNSTTTVSHPLRASPVQPLFEFVQFLIERITRAQSSPKGKQPPFASGSLLTELLLKAYRANPFDSDRKSGLPAAPWQAELAAAYMRNKFTEPLTITEVAAAAGAGTRSLQVAFGKRFGVAPRQYLETLRLIYVRNLLQSAHSGQNVTALALESGFAHLGRFARSYFERYGELPFQTLANSRDTDQSVERMCPTSRRSKASI